MSGAPESPGGPNAPTTLGRLYEARVLARDLVEKIEEAVDAESEKPVPTPPSTGAKKGRPGGRVVPALLLALSLLTAGAGVAAWQRPRESPVEPVSTDTSTHFATADAALNRGEYDRAIQGYGEAFKVGGNPVRCLFGMGNAHFSAKRFTQAAECGRRLRLLDGGKGRGFWLCGLAAEGLGDFDEARRCYELGAANEPGFKENGRALARATQKATAKATTR